MSKWEAGESLLCRQANRLYREVAADHHCTRFELYTGWLWPFL